MLAFPVFLGYSGAKWGFSAEYGLLFAIRTGGGPVSDSWSTARGLSIWNATTCISPKQPGTELCLSFVPRCIPDLKIPLLYSICRSAPHAVAVAVKTLVTIDLAKVRVAFAGRHWANVVACDDPAVASHQE